MSGKRTAFSNLQDLKNFEGGVDEVAEVADRVLASVGMSNEDAPLNARLVRDYTQRGILTRPDRQGKEAVYGYQQLVELVSARLLLVDGWPLAKVSDFVANTKVAELEALIASRNAALRAIDDIRARTQGSSRRSTTERGAMSMRAPDVAGRQMQLFSHRSSLPVRLSKIAGAFPSPLRLDYVALSLADDLHILVGDERLKNLTLEEAEAIGQAVTAALVNQRSKGGKG